MSETQQSGPACALGPLWWPTVCAPEREESGAESVCGFENVTRSKGSPRVNDLGGIDLGKDPVCQLTAKS